MAVYAAGIQAGYLTDIRNGAGRPVKLQHVKMAEVKL